MIAIFGALEQELGEIKKRMSVDREFSFGDCVICEGSFGNKEGVLVQTGMGKEKAVRAAEFALSNYRITLAISTGVGGALNERTQAGDFVLCTTVKCGDIETGTVKSDPQLLFLAENTLHKSGGRRLIGTGVTVSEVCSTPEAKQKLAESSSADIVDMESYWIGKVATARKISFVAIRPVFDTAQDDVSSINRITLDGKVVPARLAANLVTHPGLALKLVRFGNISRKIAKELADFLFEYIEVVPG